jgi:hypothetical protein
MVLVAANPHLENLVHATAILLPKRILASAFHDTTPACISSHIYHRCKVQFNPTAASSAAIAADFFMATKSQLAASAKGIGLMVLYP